LKASFTARPLGLSDYLYVLCENRERCLRVKAPVFLPGIRGYFARPVKRGGTNISSPHLLWEAVTRRHSIRRLSRIAKGL
jgi:hypothetical protein